MSHGLAGSRILLVGLGATLVVFAISYALSAPYSPEFYQSWIAFMGISSVPALLVAGMLWHYKYPASLAQLNQPLRGCAYLALTVMAMIGGGAFLYFGPGSGGGATPMLINAAIMSIVVAFWLIGVWKCWPLSHWVRSPVMLGFLVWAASYLIAYAAYEALFNFAAAHHAPFYRPALDPGGLFDSWQILVFAVTTSAVIVALEKLFEFWPTTGMHSTQSPFLHGLSNSVLVFIVSSLWMGFFVGFLRLEIVDFMLRGPIALLFGIFFVTNLSQSRILPDTPQPRKGATLLVLAIFIGVAMEELYRVVAPLVVGQALSSGPPEHDLELWVATALLAVTFPVIIVVTGYFDFWPLKRP